ncbi:hypothetical protein SODALDRAFT_130561 [Sodiomyces alkalinus F11]|uniref:Uncharacterized protein n=1 Tax=Sodiomyces alkalinus (strain CBS 110278 / VKM F-3762 / F11) TaxID=1314773 RepID=A0A3N2PYE7_SODAK|nr:hypothetical protein SODALDRAFT_130561 [Sodiomyces alkalinus F11]ROT39468.1 hypothetical protein SODALDRAFT_130561 [Sodiomyces alkalinus F11]
MCSRDAFPSPYVRSAALKIGRTASLDSFLQFVCRAALHWEEFVGQAHINASEQDAGHGDEDDDIDVRRQATPDSSWSGEQNYWEPPLWDEVADWNDNATYHNQKIPIVTECRDPDIE